MCWNSLHRESRRAPGAHLHRFPSAKAAQVRISSTHARHPPACSCARAGAQGARAESRRASLNPRRLANCWKLFAPSRQLKQSHPPESIRQYVISGAESEADVLAVLQARQANRRSSRGIGQRSGHDARAAVRIDRVAAGLKRNHAPSLERSRVPATARFLGTMARGHARLFRLQQRWRDAHQHVGTLQGSP